jgi:hypothetical protein
LIGFLAPYLSELYCPLIGAKNPKPQRNDISDSFVVVNVMSKETIGELMDKNDNFDLWVADKDQWLKFRKQ